jgi:hypothetical protein
MTREKESDPENNWSLPELESRYTKGQQQQERANLLSVMGKDGTRASQNVDNLLSEIKTAIGRNKPVTGEARSILKKILANNRSATNASV